MSKLVKSNLPRSKFPFILGRSKLVKSNLPRSKFPFIFFLGGVPRFLSTYIHTHYRLDKLRSTLVEAQLKSLTDKCFEMFQIRFFTKIGP